MPSRPASGSPCDGAMLRKERPDGWRRASCSSPTSSSDSCEAPVPSAGAGPQPVTRGGTPAEQKPRAGCLPASPPWPCTDPEDRFCGGSRCVPAVSRCIWASFSLRLEEAPRTRSVWHIAHAGTGLASAERVLSGSWPPLRSTLACRACAPSLPGPPPPRGPCLDARSKSGAQACLGPCPVEKVGS